MVIWAFFVSTKQVAWEGIIAFAPNETSLSRGAGYKKYNLPVGEGREIPSSDQAQWVYLLEAGRSQKIYGCRLTPLAGTYELKG